MKRDFAPWLLLPSVVLAVSTVTLLAPHQPALAAPQAAAPQAAPQPAAAEEDELLEHWGDPKYSAEARVQMAGMTLGFAVLGAVSAARRRRRSSTVCEVLPLPSESDFLKLDTRDTPRKAA